MTTLELGCAAHRCGIVPATHTYSSAKTKVRTSHGAGWSRNTGTDRSAGFSGCVMRAGGAAYSAPKKVERFADEPKLYDEAAWTLLLLKDEAGLEET